MTALQGSWMSTSIALLFLLVLQDPGNLMVEVEAAMVQDRREFPRLKAPVLCRPAGLLVRLLHPRETIDISLGGVRIFSDDPVKVGALLSLDLFLPDQSTVVCKGKVVWVEELPPGAPALYDVGLRFTELTDTDKGRLSQVLEK
jgi:PilZ domain